MAAGEEEPLHVALFLHTLSGGGAERNLVRLANAWSCAGHRVDFVLGEKRGPLLTALDPRVHVIELGRPNRARAVLSLGKLSRPVRRALGSDRLGPKPKVLSFVAPLASYLREHEPVGLLTSVTKNAIVALEARRLSGAKTRIVAREANSLAHETARLGATRGPRMRSMVRATYPEADAIACVSRGVADELTDLAGLAAGVAHTIYNPIDVEQVARLASEPLEDDWFTQGAPPVVVAAGRLSEQKRFQDLVSAVASIRSERPCRLMILGVGPARDALVAQASELGFGDDLRLLGFVENPYAYLARASVFALSSAWEGFPNVLLEALACGCPVVSTDCEFGPEELLAGGRFGALVPVADVKAMASALRGVLFEGRGGAPQDLRRRAAEYDPVACDAEYLDLIVGRDQPHEPGSGTLPPR